MSKDILILTPFYPPNKGGAETFTENLVNEAKKWLNITVLTMHPLKKNSRKYEEYYYKQGFLRIHRIKWLIKQKGVWKGVTLRNALSVVPSMALKSIFLFRKNRFGVVHAQGLLSGLVGCFLKKRYKCKLCITMLALYELKGIKLIIARNILNYCDIIFVEGGNGRKNVVDMGVREDNIREFTHWCDQDKFKPFEGKSTEKVKVLFVGRPIPEKGKSILQNVERKLNNNRLEFNYVENVTYEELPNYYRNADVVCVPSQYEEGFTRVVIEAASCGCVLVTSNRGSLPEQVEEFGFSVPNERLGYVIEEMLEDDIRSYYSGISFRYARKKFSKKNSEVFLNEYTN